MALYVTDLFFSRGPLRFPSTIRSFAIDSDQDCLTGIRRACVGQGYGACTGWNASIWSSKRFRCSDDAVWIKAGENRAPVSLRWGFFAQELKDFGFLVDALAIGGVGEEASVVGLATKGSAGDGA
ncbi:hypothetical protein U1Q18_011702 [Sarracenia purpurea var. burkii]